MSNALKDLFTDQANAIREGLGDIGKIAPADFPAKTREIVALVGSGGGSSADVCYVTFMSYDGLTEHGRLPVAKGYDCPNPKFTPTRESTAQYSYVHAGWATEANGALDSNALKEVNEDRTVYANFAAVVRYYTITYLDTDGSVLKTESLAYGSTPSYVPTKDGYSFDKWTPAVTAVTGDMSYTAVWAQKLKFSNALWEDIAAVCEAGKAGEHFAVGDTRVVTVTLATSSKTYSVDVVFEILGINHDDLADGTGKAGITIGTQGAVNQTYFARYSNAEMNNGWGSSSIRTALNSTGLEKLPSDMRQHIKNVTKKSKVSYNTYGTVSTSDKLFMPSNTEFTGSSETYGAQYEHYKTVDNRKMHSIGTGGLNTSEYVNHYTRTPGTTNGWLNYIDKSGTYVSNATENLYCVVCCCI